MDRLQQLAQTNNAEAIYHLGMMYQTGTGVALDHQKALEAFRRATALGDPLAAYKLGCYYSGQDRAIISPDETLALKYKLVAAVAGYALAQQDVAVIYAVRGDGASAAPWAEKSAVQGWADGLATAASIFNVAPGLRRDPAKVAAYFQLALTRMEASPRQRQWLDAFKQKMSKADLVRADDIVRHYRPSPTALTLKALSGQRAAEALLAR